VAKADRSELINRKWYHTLYKELNLS
jgi:hypothetical protein